MTDTLDQLIERGWQIPVSEVDALCAEFDWSDMDRYVAHQVSRIHTRAMCRALELDPDRVPLTFPTRGNMGPAAVPFTLATQADSLEAGHRVLLLGVGSGLNACFAEVIW